MANNQDFPFSIPLTLYDVGGNPQSVRAEFGSQFPQAAFGSLIVLTQDVGPSKAGLYLYYPDRWRQVIPYSYIDDYVIAGGVIKVWCNLTGTVAVDSGASVFRNGNLDNVTQMNGTTGVLWATILANPSSGLSYQLPIASSSTLGGVKIGSGVTIAGDGTISVAASALTPATTSALGGVIVPTTSALTVDGSGNLGLNLGTGLSIASNKLTPAIASVVGTAKQVIVTASNGTVTLSTPQNIDTTASPTFAGLNSTGAVNVQGALSSSGNTNPASITNSGVSLNVISPNGGGVDMYDSSQTANNKTGSILFYQGAMRFRFYNDAHGTAVEPLVLTGGQATGVTSIALATSTAGLTLGPSGAITSSSPSNSWAHTGNFTVVTGAISSSAGAGIASATNSGVNLNYGGTYGMVSMYDSTRTANNRSADLLFINGGVQLRFANDGYTAFASALNISGGQASGVASIAATTANTNLTLGNNVITSNSGTGAWTHTGSLTATQSGGNGVTITPVANGQVPTITSSGANANVSLNINTQGSGGINLNSSTAVTGNLTATGTINSIGTIGTSSNTNPAGPTNSGATIQNSTNYVSYQAWDTTQTANNKGVDWFWSGGILKLRLISDNTSSSVVPFSVTGGQATGITGITSNSGTGSWVHTGALTTTGVVTMSSGYTVASLPAGVKGMCAYVTDANNPTWNSPVAGGGSNTVLVFYNGNSWVCA